jgi:hypothetical protein
MEIMDTDEIQTHTIQARFVSDSGEEAGPPIDLPVNVDVQQLELICNAILKNVSFYCETFSLLNDKPVNFYRRIKLLTYSLSTTKKSRKV